MARRPFFYHLPYALAASALLFATATDAAYFLSTDFVWVDMSDWLVSAGAVVGLFALIVGVVEIVTAPRWRRPSWLFGLASLLAFLVAGLNMFVHSRDGLTSVVPLGLGLSALTCVLLLFAWWSHFSTTIDQTPAEISA